MAQPRESSIQTAINDDVIHLVSDIFITGTCKNVENIESSGPTESFGTFQNGENVIGLSDGIMLSTGDVRSAMGPNESIETSTRYNRLSTDKDLIDIATSKLFDVTVLEFDFIPVKPEVSFQYVFASEEYCEFVGTQFNDVFGFFVSGPGIDGPFSDDAINIARLPDSEEFVSINTVNHESNQGSYVKNELSQDVGNCNISFNPREINTLEFDGFTVPLLARIRLIPCETYHIRLVVGDVGDDKLDSAVFLLSNSFDLGELATIKANIPNRKDTTAYENCLDGQFVFTRPKGSFNTSPLEIDFEINELSTALEGIDFSTIPKTITIPPRQDSVVLSISTLIDEQAENLESLTLTLLGLCECKEGSSATLNLSDPIPPTIRFTPTFVCANQPFSIIPEIINGVSPFSFRWDDNSVDTSLQINIQTPTNYALTITDLCGNQTNESVQINIQDIPSAVLSGEVDYCEGLDNIRLPLNFMGHPPWSFTYQIDNNFPITIENIVDSSFNLPISEGGNYQLIEFSDAACTGSATGTGQVNDINIDLRIEAVAPSCSGIDDGAINLIILEGNPPYDINWMPSVNDLTNPTNLSVGVYDLIVRDAQNCVFIDSINVENSIILAPECINHKVYIPNIFSPNGDGINDFFEIFFDPFTTIQRVLKVEIIDRWGNLVYVSEGIMPKWDGQFRGRPLDPAVFLYSIQLELLGGRTELLQGSLNLVR